MSKVTEYFDHVRSIADRVQREQLGHIETAGALMAEGIAEGHRLFAFGASHAGILAEELFYRTGGLALMNPIFSPILMLSTRPVTLTSQMERLEGHGQALIRESAVASGDVVLIHSVSGRNAVSIDAALASKERGARVVALTSMEYSRNVTARHSSGKNLYAHADVVIDNCGDFEDSSMKLEGLEQKIAPTSTAVGAMIVNGIVISVVENLIKRGIEPPVFHSANVDGGDAFNARLFERYRDRIFYMR